MRMIGTGNRPSTLSESPSKFERLIDGPISVNVQIVLHLDKNEVDILDTEVRTAAVQIRIHDIEAGLTMSLSTQSDRTSDCKPELKLHDDVGQSDNTSTSTVRTSSTRVQVMPVPVAPPLRTFQPLPPSARHSLADSCLSSLLSHHPRIRGSSLDDYVLNYMDDHWQQRKFGM